MMENDVDSKLRQNISPWRWDVNTLCIISSSVGSKILRIMVRLGWDGGKEKKNSFYFEQS